MYSLAKRTVHLAIHMCSGPSCSKLNFMPCHAKQPYVERYHRWKRKVKVSFRSSANFNSQCQIAGTSHKKKTHLWTVSQHPLTHGHTLQVNNNASQRGWDWLMGRLKKRSSEEKQCPFGFFLWTCPHCSAPPTNNLFPQSTIMLLANAFHGQGMIVLTRQ